MIINSVNGFEKLVDSAKQLEDKNIIKLIKSLLPQLNSRKLQHLAEILETAIADAFEAESDVLEGRAKFLYKTVKSNNYVSLVAWGKDECNEYLGPMPFLPGITYKLTHMITGETKTLKGHKLERRQNQIYMVVEELDPIHKTLDYLYYDRDLEFPRRPQDVCIKTVFSKKKWQIEKLTHTSTTDISVKENTNHNGVLDKILKPTHQLSLGSEKKEVSKDSVSSKKLNLLGTTNSSKSSLVRNSARRQASLTTVQVNKHSINQVKILMAQWVELTKVLQFDYHWQLVTTENAVRIYERSGRTLVECNDNSHIVTAKSPHLLLESLINNLKFVSNSSQISADKKNLVDNYLLRFSNAPKEDATKLLAYIFSL
ncbi:hypothetical protein [Chlorogloea sp. CCALA 695]|uniref:hypothetical protein n=1 Tax=Chlorogloea sp. CCALA 695 TaxID=2107693 RepID=UPI000D059D82|nr:hypothetical protein [Chlorogloea sp. CCALA 695]PSB26418.1 hypothetical protein C7B70_23940 [Chlorogloea sp. CCALA 695]